jgi:homoserine kinase
MSPHRLLRGASAHPPARVRATVPGSIGNLGPGLDVIGCAVTGLRDEVLAEWSEVDDVVVLDAGHADLPTDSARHASALAASAVLRAVRARGARLPAGIAITACKRLPLSGGQGGSAASAVAGAAAANALLGDLLDDAALLECCLVAEEAVAGRHLDNIAPALLGGIVLVRALDPIDLVRLPVPDGLRIVLAHPSQQLNTSDARRALPAGVPRATAVHQIAQVGAVVAACYTGDLALLGRAMDDRIAEPARAPLLPGFVQAKLAALEAGALGASISGGGSTSFALAEGDDAAYAIGDAMQGAYNALGIACTVRVTEIDVRGAIVEAA